MKITRSAAEAYFAHPTQRKASCLEGPLPDFCEYYAQGNVCGAVHWGPWPGLLIGHFGVNPKGWGSIDGDMTALLHEVWQDVKPERIAGWIKESNRAARALCLRVGMTQDGRLPMAEPVLLMGWSA